uniref:Uncharacterized protein n=1 Tax=Glossina brevipalpis TaxID=37001 RepID=A0A1A9WFL0_9MUSC
MSEDELYDKEADDEKHGKLSRDPLAKERADVVVLLLLHLCLAPAISTIRYNLHVQCNDGNHYIFLFRLAKNDGTTILTEKSEPYPYQ